MLGERACCLLLLRRAVEEFCAGRVRPLADPGNYRPGGHGPGVQVAASGEASAGISTGPQNARVIFPKLSRSVVLSKWPPAQVGLASMLSLCRAVHPEIKHCPLQAESACSCSLQMPAIISVRVCQHQCLMSHACHACAEFKPD